MKKQQFIDKVNDLALKKISFLFIMDFEKKIPIVLTKNEALDKNILFKVGDQINYKPLKKINKKSIYIQKFPMDKNEYLMAFNKVQYHLRKGNTYLLNLTFPTKVLINETLEDIFHYADSNYKILMKDYFLSYSPECFIKIKNNKIFSYPMKGTISSLIENAKRKIIDDKKELWEHSTIVDLIRNDLALFASKIKVNRFRYLEEVSSDKSSLFQVSSEVQGDLPFNWQSKLGDLIWGMLPAGSVSGAPKEKTLEIIRSVEKGSRGYYSGVYGYFDGFSLDSAVSIRFIENAKDGYYYRSGGGITANSEFENEFDELLRKIYVPTF